MNRVVQARARLGEIIRLARPMKASRDLTVARINELGERIETAADAAQAHLDLELEEQELGRPAVEDPALSEWQDGWPPGTWLDSFGFVFEVGMTARSSEGSLLYLVPAIYFGLEPTVSRWISFYAASVTQARLANGRVYTRTI